MATPRKLSHTATMHALIDVLTENPPNVPPGSQYGFYSCTASVAVSGIVTKVFNGYYTPEQAIRVAPCGELPLQTVNHSVITGLGLVVKKEEIKVGPEAQGALRVVVRHHDWDGESRKMVSFDIIYIVFKKTNLANSFGLFQIGREVNVSGTVCDRDDEAHTWTVKLATVSVTVGQTTRPGDLSLGLTDALKQKSRTLVLGKEAPVPIAGTNTLSSSSHPLPSTTTSPLPLMTSSPALGTVANVPVEEDEIPVESSSPTYNTFAKKRLRDDILADAKKRARRP